MFNYTPKWDISCHSPASMIFTHYFYSTRHTIIYNFLQHMMSITKWSIFIFNIYMMNSTRSLHDYLILSLFWKEHREKIVQLYIYIYIYIYKGACVCICLFFCDKRIANGGEYDIGTMMFTH